MGVMLSCVTTCRRDPASPWPEPPGHTSTVWHGLWVLAQLPHSVEQNPLCIWVFSFVSSLGDVLVSGLGLHDFHRAIKPCIFIWKIKRKTRAIRHYMGFPTLF